MELGTSAQQRTCGPTWSPLSSEDSTLGERECMADIHFGSSWVKARGSWFLACWPNP